MHISYLEARSRYEGTVLGILWIPVSTLSFSLLLGFVFRGSSTMTQVDFFLYVICGYVSWNFISDSISGSTGIIQKRFDFAIHNNLSLLGLFAKVLADRGFEFGLDLLTVFLVFLVLAPWAYGPQMLLLVAFIPILAVTSLAASYIVNLATLFYPDLANILSTAVRLMMFATPVFWVAEERSGLRPLLEAYNPASYYLMMMRQAFGVQPVSAVPWLIGCGITLVVCIVGFIAYRRTSSFVRNLR
jgi:lipopolysaccharide transport system permease protein